MELALDSPTPMLETSMLTRDIDAFFSIAKLRLADQPGCAKGAYLVIPEGFSLADESARDNVYMDLKQSVNADLAMAQHRNLARAISQHLPTICFPGRAETPDAVFPNNAFATAKNKVILGHMRHSQRQMESRRSDMRGFFCDILNYDLIDLEQQPGTCELTGSLIIDRSRNIAFCGLSERCDEIGASAMYEAFGLDACLMFDLAPGEYHANVVLTVLAGRAAILAPDGFADVLVSDAIAGFYGSCAVILSVEEKNAFAANAIALREDAVWMSQAASDKLSAANRQILEAAGFNVYAVDLSEIEKAGGSLRCCIGEIY